MKLCLFPYVYLAIVYSLLSFAIGLPAFSFDLKKFFLNTLDMSPLSDTGFANIVSVAFLLILLTGSLLEQKSNLLLFFSFMNYAFSRLRTLFAKL